MCKLQVYIYLTASCASANPTAVARGNKNLSAIKWFINFAVTTDYMGKRSENRTVNCEECAEIVAFPLQCDEHSVIGLAIQCDGMRCDARLRTMTKALQWKWNDAIQFALHTIELNPRIDLNATVGKIGEYFREMRTALNFADLLCDFESSFITL